MAVIKWRWKAIGVPDQGPFESPEKAVEDYRYQESYPRTIQGDLQDVQIFQHKETI